MKITKLTTFVVPPRWMFLKVETDAGISGWGEPILEGHAETLVAKIGELEDLVVGSDPRLIEDMWQKVYRSGCYRGGPILMSAISGLDMALWDIKGKWLGQPVHMLIGGQVRDKIRTYRWTGGDRPANLTDGVLALREEGFDAVKFNACAEFQIVDTYAKVDRVLKSLHAVREAVGETMDLALDFHGRVHAPMAKVLVKELQSLRPMFIEDVVDGAHLDKMADLNRSSTVPLCVGERLYSRFAFKEVFERRAASIINPDTAHAGGISEMVRIAAMAEAYDVAVAPHCPLGPIALSASLQVDAVCHNAFIQEQSIGIHYNQGADVNDYLTDATKITVENGFLSIPKRPGLGIELDEDFLHEKASIGHRWRPPIWRHADGSIAEW
ncbi:MAG: galactonate dehydratase [Roseitalea porphyridii]|jgi:galactonate dehydratase|uniref:galactonate dehydratase n=1 Tax=Alphaproteobacteria TaxID=28211 RepID=UPI0032EC5CB0